MDKIKIMPFGDSITDGYNVVGGYRNKLCDLLEENGYSNKVMFVGSGNSGTGYDGHHEGHSAWAIDDISASDDGEKAGRNGLLPCADKWLADAMPDIVLLQIGTNDVLSLYKLDEIDKRLCSLLDKIFNVLPEYGTIFLARIPYIDADSPCNHTGKTQTELNTIIDTYNKKIDKIAEENDKISISDINSVLEFSDLHDGLHPNKDGYNKMGMYWYNTIKSKLDELLEE